MPMATEPGSAARRRWLMAAAAVWLSRHSVGFAMPRHGASTATTATAPPLLATAWNDARGRHFIGLLAIAGQQVRIDASIEVPTRAHAIAVEPGGSVLAVARRPGDWLLRWQPHSASARAAAQWQWADEDRCFTGHTLRSPDGHHLYTAETDLRSGAGRLVQRDVDSLAVMREWPTRGSDPHDLQWLPSGRLLVANGGIATLPETGRAKRALDRMDSSIIEIDTRHDEVGPSLRLADPRLSLRHLALHLTGQVGIALQAEHDDPADRARAPVLALYDPATGALHSVPHAPLLQGYGGDVAALPEGWVVSCPRADQLAFFALDGSWQGQLPLDAACALAVAEDASQAWAVGAKAVVALGGTRAGPCGVAGLQIDNHVVVWLQRPAPG